MADETEIERLIVRIVGDNQAYVKSLADSQKQTKTAMQGVEKTIQQSQERIVAQRQSLAQAIGGAGIAASLFGLGREAIAGFAEAELAEVKLTTALESNGRQVQETLKIYKDYANQLQEITTMEDDAVIALFKTAEAYEITGDTAKRAIHDAVALAAVNDSSTESMIRLTAAMAKGDVQTAMRFGRMIPQLRGVRDEAQFLAKYTQLVATGFKQAQAEAGTFTGQMKQLRVAWGNLLEDFGEVLVDWLKPIVSGFKTVVGWFKSLSKEAKQTIAIVAGVLAAIGFAAFLSALNSIFPVFTAFMAILKSAIAVLLFFTTPIGLVIAALAGLAYYVAYYTKIGADALSWFGAQWQKLVEYVKPALDAIRNALAAGEINLAVKIMWAQVKLSWFQGIQPLREAWVGFTNWLAVQWTHAIFFLEEQWIKLPLTWQKTVGFLREGWAGFTLFIKQVWIETSTFLQSGWQTTTDWIAEQLLKLKGVGKAALLTDPNEIAQVKEQVKAEIDELKKMGKTAQQAIADQRTQALTGADEAAAEVVNDVQANIAKVQAQLQPALDDLTELKKGALGALDDMAAGEMKAAQANVEQLQKELNALIEKGSLAKQVEKEGDAAIPKAKEVGKAISQALGKWEAVEFRSAEALGRQLESIEAIAFGGKAAGAGGGRGGKGAGPGAFNAQNAMQPIGDNADVVDAAGDELYSINIGILELVRIGRQQLAEPRIELETAGLA
mgnify:CR=1 FL=1